MTDGPELHRQAALRHEQAASNHDRAATFWDRQGKAEQARLQRELANYERHGAELERHWAELVDPHVVDRAAEGAATARSLTRRNAEHLSAELDRAAEALEKTVALADRHARRREQAGLSDAAGEERRAADRARTCAEMARSQAEEWRKYVSQATTRGSAAASDR